MDRRSLLQRAAAGLVVAACGSTAGSGGTPTGGGTKTNNPTSTPGGAAKAATKATVELAKGGSFTIALRADKAPQTVERFAGKARSGFYNNLIFHRVEDWVVQGGDPLGTGTGGEKVPSEYNDLTFALGAVGYFLLTGRSPFPGRTAIEVFRMERQGPPAPLSSVSPNPVPAALDATIGRCLSFRRDDRPVSAEALDALLEACAVAPTWTVAQGRAWWRDRGTAALTAARAQRVERNEVLVLSGGDRAGS